MQPISNSILTTRTAVKPAALQTLHQAARPGLQQITRHDVRLLQNLSMLSKDALTRLVSPCSCITTRQRVSSISCKGGTFLTKTATV